MESCKAWNDLKAQPNANDLLWEGSLTATKTLGFQGALENISAPGQGVQAYDWGLDRQRQALESHVCISQFARTGILATRPDHGIIVEELTEHEGQWQAIAVLPPLLMDAPNARIQSAIDYGFHEFAGVLKFATGFLEPSARLRIYDERIELTLMDAQSQKAKPICFESHFGNIVTVPILGLYTLSVIELGRHALHNAR
jgi:hypothetical protein